MTLFKSRKAAKSIWFRADSNLIEEGGGIPSSRIDGIRMTLSHFNYYARYTPVFIIEGLPYNLHCFNEREAKKYSNDHI